VDIGMVIGRKRHFQISSSLPVCEALSSPFTSTSTSPKQLKSAWGSYFKKQPKPKSLFPSWTSEKIFDHLYLLTQDLKTKAVVHQQRCMKSKACFPGTQFVSHLPSG